MEYTTGSMKEAMFAYIMLYKELGIKSMIKRNHHMNEYKDEEFDETLALELLNQFVEASLPHIKLDSPNVMDITNGLVQGIPFLNECVIKLTPTVKEAIIVDFINYVAGSHGLEFKMCTKDIAMEEESNGEEQ